MGSSVGWEMAHFVVSFPEFIVDLPIKNGIYPSKMGFTHQKWDLPIKNGIYPSKMGFTHQEWDLPMKKGDVP